MCFVTKHECILYSFVNFDYFPPPLPVIVYLISSHVFSTYYVQEYNKQKSLGSMGLNRGEEQYMQPLLTLLFPSMSSGKLVSCVLPFSISSLPFQFSLSLSILFNRMFLQDWDELGQAQPDWGWLMWSCFWFGFHPEKVPITQLR